MVESLDLLVKTVLLRPYVFCFLALYLVIAWGEIGPLRTVVWLVLGYAIAFVCEYSSTRNGFPFGLYHYLDAPTRGRELWISNVPFMDSLSFVFLSFVSYATARRLLGKEPDPKGRIEASLGVLFAASTLMLGIDLICDPVALRGDRWFLGRLYYYAEPGGFFGVPLSNFLGWFFVAFTIVLAMAQLERFGLLGGRPGSLPLKPLWAPAFYLGLVLFNALIAFWIDLAGVGWLGLALVAAVGLAWWLRLALAFGQPGLEQTS